jgi:amino acid adenylation domain-containing protein
VSAAPRETLQRRFVESAREHGDRPALFVRDVTFTYAELEATARRWASVLVARLGRAPKRVGVFGFRSATAYIGVLAAQMAGATFVPLNPRFPPARTRRMATMAGLDAIIVDKLGTTQLAEVLEGLEPKPVLLLPDGEDAELVRSAAPLEELPPIAMDDVAYLLFTSGSTGEPKGVPITHANVRAYLDFCRARYSFHAEDRFSQTFDQTFDLSVHDQFLCWEAGACLFAMSPADLLAPTRFINTHQLTVWFSVPSVAAQMRKRGTLKPGSLPTLRWSLFCGEPLPRASAEAWLAAAPSSTVENLYGPTELTIACAVHRWDPEHSPAKCVNDMVSIGAPFPGLQAIVVDNALSLVKEGESGELCVAGPQTSPGYWHDRKKTAERFVEMHGARFYRTGDRVIALPDGEYACLGRVDHQVKVLGFRVELGEIESVLQRDPRVVQAVALGWPMVEGSAQGIVAFVCGADLDVGALTATCKSTLSDYMVPTAIHVVDTMPLNANGKIDRAALAEQLRKER